MKISIMQAVIESARNLIKLSEAQSYNEGAEAYNREEAVKLIVEDAELLMTLDGEELVNARLSIPSPLVVSDEDYANYGGIANDAVKILTIKSSARALGSIKSEKKAASSRENGKKGGRPRTMSYRADVDFTRRA